VNFCSHPSNKKKNFMIPIIQLLGNHSTTENMISISYALPAKEYASPHLKQGTQTKKIEDEKETTKIGRKEKRQSPNLTQ